MDFRHSIEKKDGGTLVLKLEGYFDEFAQLPESLDLDSCRILNVNFEKVDFINSGGIKLWVNFVESFESQDNLKVIFSHCKRMIVDQVNLVEGFLPKNGRVESVFVPIYCESCDLSGDFFIEVSKVGEHFEDIARKAELNDCEQERCRKNFEIDVVKDHFFRFMNEN